jgi:hypothetical protein
MTDIQDGEVLSPGGVAVAPDGMVYVMNSGFFRDAANPFGSGYHAKLIEYTPGGGSCPGLCHRCSGTAR